MKHYITLIPEASRVLAKSKQILADAVQFVHLQPDGSLRLVYDASNDVMGVALSYVVWDTSQPLGFFAMKV